MNKQELQIITKRLNETRTLKETLSRKYTELVDTEKYNRDEANELFHAWDEAQEEFLSIIRFMQLIGYTWEINVFAEDDLYYVFKRIK